MARTPGEHLERKAVKTEIIKFILGHSEAVKEPDIRSYLNKKYGINDESNVRKHLRDLCSSKYMCIEKIPGKPGLANYWDIKKTENLKNISLHFPKIRLNEYEKSINVVLWRTSLGFNRLLFKRQLTQSTSFFKVCLETEPKTLYVNALLIYRLGAGYDKYESVKKEVSELLPLYLKNHPGVEISVEAFLKMPRAQCQEILVEILKETPEELFGETVGKVIDVLYFRREEYFLIPPLIFDHYVNNDILTGILSSVEIESLFRAKEENAWFIIESKKELHPTIKNWTLINIFVSLGECEELVDIWPGEKIKKWIKFSKCWSEGSNKFQRYKNELDEINKEIEKWKNEGYKTGRLHPNVDEIIYGIISDY